MAQTLKSKISQMANAYSINAIIETAKQVQKENSTQYNVLDYETSEKLIQLKDIVEKTMKDLERELALPEHERRTFRISATSLSQILRGLTALTDRVILTREWENK